MKTYIATHKLLGELAIKGIKVTVIEKEAKMRGDYSCTVIEYTKQIEMYLKRNRR